MRLHEMMIRFGGHALLLNAEAALFWPAQKTLIVSDLHFEKGSFLARAGSFIPPYDTQDTLDRLEQLVTHYQPERLILLGDSFHDRNAWARLDEALRGRIIALAGRVRECVWIEGNHDAALNAHPLGTLTGSVQIAGIHFAHDEELPQRPAIIGHYHPKAHIALAGRSARGKCFIHSSELLIMPSFGSYTGGLDIRHAAIRSALGDGAPQVHLIYRKAIYRLPGM